jgi:DUF1680 family protein
VPGRPHPRIHGDWRGEYVGTWLSAGDAALRGKIDAMVADWLSTQQADGYLGTFDESDRRKS